MSSPSRSSSLSLRNLEWTPKCQYGYKSMIPKTSRTTSNPGAQILEMPRFAWRRGYGLLIWMDELVSEWIPKSNSGSGQIEAKMEQMKSSFEEMRLEIRHLRESLERKNRGNGLENGVAYMFVIILFFVAYI